MLKTRLALWNSPGLHNVMCNSKSIILFLCVMVLVLLYLQETGKFIREFQRSKDVAWKVRKPPKECSILSANSSVTYDYTVRPEEANFPLAFSLVVYTDESRVIRLLRAIYRPHNYYCIHIDRKSSANFVKAIESLKQCPELKHNVFFVEPKDRVYVHWGGRSVLDADLICARLLMARAPYRWKYWINLTGQEFPLRTNWELVRALRLLNGSNIVDAIYRRRIMGRLPPYKDIPFKLTFYKGSVHIAVRYEYTEYALNARKAKALYAALANYEKRTGWMIMPEETFFATLNHNPHVFPIPGAFTGVHENDVAIPLARAKKWSDDSGAWCGSGYWRRMICMYGLWDLPYLLKQPHFFANKFLPNVEPLAFDIIELWIAAKVRNETKYGRLADLFNQTYYRTSPYATQHL